MPSSLKSCISFIKGFFHPELISGLETDLRTGFLDRFSPLSKSSTNYEIKINNKRQYTKMTLSIY